jgi:2-dehydropantoate 2-reductase
MTRVCVFGAGAIGGHLAGRLAKGGAEVSVVARGAHLDAIRANGLHVKAPDGDIHVKVAASQDPAELGVQDAVLVTAKAPALPGIATALAPLLREDTPVVFVTNGIPWWYFHRHGGELDGRSLPRVDPDDTILRAVGLDRAVGAVVNSACEVIAPGVVNVESARSRLTMGTLDGSEHAMVTQLAGLLQAGGMDGIVTPRIRDTVWTKLMGNLSGGPLAVLTQAAPCETTAEPACEAAIRAIIAEGQAVAHALGAQAKADPDAQIANARRSRHKPSILQDLLLGRPMEVDAIYAVPLELAKMAKVHTPMLELIVALLRLRARSAGLYAG